MTIFSGCLSLLFSPSVFLFGYQYWRSGYMQAHRVPLDVGRYAAATMIDYDADGNLVQDEAGRTLAYDSLGRLSSVSVLVTAT